jgi:hypothetical protein
MTKPPNTACVDMPRTNKRKLTGDEFEANVKAAIAAVKSDPQALYKANQLLYVVGCTGRCHEEEDFSSIRPPKEHQALVVEALLLGVRAYLDHPPSAESRLQHALAGLYGLDAWRPLVECHDTVHAAARTFLLMGLYLGHRRSRGLEILNDWLKPATRFAATGSDGDFQRLQQEIVTDMFGDAWWLFNGHELGLKFDLNKITEQKPLFRIGLLDVASEDPQVLPEMTHSI